jgi:hypothetical protein
MGPLTVRAQQPGRRYRLGILHNQGPHDVPDIIRSRSRACGVCQGPQGQVVRRASNPIRHDGTCVAVCGLNRMLLLFHRACRTYEGRL